MPVIRLALLLAVLGGLTLFALQNWSPVVPLVVLGVQTQAFPLAVWMVGAIAAGAFTTLVIAALFGISNTFSTTRTRRPAARRETSRTSASADESWDKGWNEPQNSSYSSTAATAATASSANTTTSYTQSASSKPKSSFDFRNDWENVGAPVEEWEDWQDYEEPVDTPRPQASSATSPSYSSYNSQTYIQEPEQEPEQEREEWEDWEDESPPQTSTQSQRTDYEVRQDPKTSYQSGSVYSYSYREPSDSGVGKTESVYDADYRVIIPPARSLDEIDGEPPANQDTDEEDWDFEDEFEEGDRPRR